VLNPIAATSTATGTPRDCYDEGGNLRSW